MNTETVLSNDRIVEIARKLRWQTQYSEIQDNAIELARAIEQAVLQSIANDPDRINAAAKALSKHLDYPWEFMAAEGRDSMRTAAMVTISAAIKEQP